jgi:hypothetical protein
MTTKKKNKEIIAISLSLSLSLSLYACMYEAVMVFEMKTQMERESNFWQGNLVRSVK